MTELLPLPLPPLVVERLGMLRERPIEPTEKGFGSLRGRASAASLAAARLPLAEAGLVFPLLTLRESALAGELAADPGFEAYCYVDSPEGVAILDTQLRRHPAGRPLAVLVEIGHAGGRTGCRTDEQALAVAKAAQAAHRHGGRQRVLRCGDPRTDRGRRRPGAGHPAQRPTCGWTPRPILRRATWSAWAFRIRAPRWTSGGSWWC